MRYDTGELTRLAADLGRASATVTRRASQAVRKAAFDVESRAKRLAPVDTGALRNSISTTVSGGGLAATVGPTVHYGIYQELGTRRMRPHPYMGPAADAVLPGFEAAMAELGANIL